MQSVRELLRDLVLEKGIVDIIMDYKKKFDIAELEDRNFFKSIVETICTKSFLGIIHPITIRNENNDRLVFKIKQEYEYSFMLDIGQKITTLFIVYKKYKKEEEELLFKLSFSSLCSKDSVEITLKNVFLISEKMITFI